VDLCAKAYRTVGERSTLYRRSLMAPGKLGPADIYITYILTHIDTQLMLIETSCYVGSVVRCAEGSLSTLLVLKSCSSRASRRRTNYDNVRIAYCVTNVYVYIACVCFASHEHPTTSTYVACCRTMHQRVTHKDKLGMF
jgi:hypothetical protein